MDTVPAAQQPEHLHVVTPDGRSFADLSVLQGFWSEAMYLRLTDQCSHLVEFTDGRLEILPMPTDQHQAISGFLYLLLSSFVRKIGGKALYAPLRLRIREGKFREPGLLALRDAKDPRRRNDYWLGADLVMEVVSPSNPGRDIVDKRLDYAEASIPEYWIVNAIDETITVLQLVGGRYVEHGVFQVGGQAGSASLPGFSVNVQEVFAVE